MTGSEQLGELAKALAKARKSFKPIKKSSENPFYHSKYADLAEVLEATKDGLSDNGLHVIQSLGKYENKMLPITTKLIHESGQWIEDTMWIPVGKDDAQGVGSAATYGRRYSYSAFLNVASESDDDANAAIGEAAAVKPPKRKSAPEVMPAPADDETIKLRKRLFALGREKNVIENGDLKRYIVETFAVEHTSDLKVPQLKESIGWLEQLA